MDVTFIPNEYAAQGVVIGHPETVAAIKAEVERLTADWQIMMERQQRMVFKADYDADIQRIGNVRDRYRAALEKIRRIATGEDQVADDDTDGMAWIAKEAMQALHSVLPLD